MMPNKPGLFNDTKSTTTSNVFQQRHAKLQLDEPQPEILHLSTLNLNDRPSTSHKAIPDDIEQSKDPSMDRLRLYAKSLPYPIEPNSKMQELLDFYLARMVQCVKAKDFDPGFLQWDTMFA